MKENRIYIIGAGFAGESIADEIKKKGVLGRVVALADDDPNKIGSEYGDIPIVGPIDRIRDLLKENPADEALIAIPSASTEELFRIYRTLKKAGFSRINLLPGISQIRDGEAHLIQTREIDAQDFLRREPVVISLKKSLEYLRGKRVLITGAGGSIGSELSRQLLSGGAERLYLLGHGENSIYEIERELRILQEEGVGEKAAIVPIIGELLDREYMFFILNRLKADVVFHCAAYKHVPMLESNPIEAIKNNVFGTSNLVDAAADSDTSRFVFISTDKAVNPISIYGASKMIAEEIVLGQKNETKKFMVVRFGNVLGSRGSIIPLLRKQISKGGPVTITHPDTSRFFMTIPEASSLVLQTGGVGEGNSLYILEMGKPLNITELAKQLISFHGFTPEEEIPIKFIGLRPGEKLTERLWNDDETPVQTRYPYINRLERRTRFNGELDSLIENLRNICFLNKSCPALYRNRRELRRLLSIHIPALAESENEPEY